MSGAAAVGLLVALTVATGCKLFHGPVDIVLLPQIDVSFNPEGGPAGWRRVRSALADVDVDNVENASVSQTV